MARPFQFRLRTLLLLVPLVGAATLLARHLPGHFVLLGYVAIILFAAWAMDGIAPPLGLRISVTIALSLVVLAACLFALSLSR
ncbi:MAG: hypothetical protein WD847_02040 [Pirellulales bacterium]